MNNDFMNLSINKAGKTTQSVYLSNPHTPDLLSSTQKENRSRNHNWATAKKSVESVEINLDYLHDSLANELIQFEPKINNNKDPNSKLEEKLLYEKRHQRMSLISQASTRPAVSFQGSSTKNGFNQYAKKRIPVWEYGDQDKLKYYIHF